MIHAFFLRIAIVLTFLASVAGPPAHAQSGGEHSGGGGYREIQFRNIGYEIVNLLEDASNVPQAFKQIPWKSLRKIIKTTHVESTDAILRPSPGGKPEPALIKDMLNIPGRKRIEFNRDAWDLFPSGGRRAALVLHEYLGILKHLKLTRLDDSLYQISHYLYDHPAMKLYFDNSEIAQTITGAVPLDFPIACEYSYAGQPFESLGLIGSWKSKGVSTQSGYLQRNLTRDPRTKSTLQLTIYDESDVNLPFMRVVPAGHLKSSIRFLIGWNKNHLGFPQQVEFDQSVAIAPNFQFEFNLERLKLRLKCKRVRTTVARPKDLGEE